MTVGKLIELLKRADKDKQVYIYDLEYDYCDEVTGIDIDLDGDVTIQR